MLHHITGKSAAAFSALATSLLFLLLLAFSPFIAQAASASQEQCFSYLVGEVKEVPAFADVSTELASLTYSDLESKLSRPYKNASSFGIDLASGDFSLRVYSFGLQTGYVHPPYSPFPIYTLSEKWEQPAKQYIIAEEYVDGPDGQPIFLSCAFMEIQSNDMMGVTAERYLYDGPLTSLVKNGSDGVYRAWYTSNVSYDHEDVEFVRWNRLFVYPKATQNEYFDRYTVATAFPSNSVDSFDIVIDTSVKLDDQGRPIPNVSVNDFEYSLSGDEMTIVLNYDALTPIRPEGNDKIFFLNSYYQEIQNTFPEFAERIALRGLLRFDTVKELLLTGTVSEFSTLWKTILDSRDFTRYALVKEQGLLQPNDYDGTVRANEVNMKFEDQLKQIASMTIEQDARTLLDEITNRDNVIEETPTIEPLPEDIPTPLEKRFEMNWMEVVAIIVGAIVLFVAAFWFWWRRREHIVNEDISASNEGLSR